MNIIKYIFSILLIIWGLLVSWNKLFMVGLHFPFLTVITFIAIIMCASKQNKADLILFLASCLWVIFSTETIGYLAFFNVGTLLAGGIPLILGIGVMLSSKSEIIYLNTLIKKLFLISLLILIGIGSHVYKPITVEVNCWYYFDNDKTYNVLFAKAPERTFEVELSSDEIKKEVKAKGLQYEGRIGYYCPETKIHLMTSFGKILSAQILSFRNSEKDKEVYFSSPTKIPLEKVNGKLEILNPIIPRMRN